MVQIDFSTFICYYLMGSVIVAAFLATAFPGRAASSVRSRERLWQCGVCLYVYRDVRRGPISVCPQCASLNKRSSTMGGER
jgi:hypothetical protein